jgi:hypothetical protein
MSWSPASRTDVVSVSQEEKSQLLIVFENAKINYSKTQTIDFKPHMLGIPSRSGSSSMRMSSTSMSSSSSSSSAANGLAIYLPEKHNVEYVFNRYIKIYKNSVGNPATVFIDNRTYAEYTQFANELIKNEKTAGPTPPPRGPHDLIDDDKIRMINNNISFVINTLFRKNRIITTGAKKDKIQTIVAEKPATVDQGFYLEAYNVHPMSYSLSGGTKKYESGDVRILEKETAASELKTEIDNLATDRKNAEKAWSDAKQAYATALTAFKTTAPPIPLITKAKDDAQEEMNKKRDEYLEARNKEKEKIEERNKIVSEINQLRYGVYPNAVNILKTIRELKEGVYYDSSNRDYYSGFISRSSTSDSSLKGINKAIIVTTNEIELLKEKKKKHEEEYRKMGTDLLEEKRRILEDILGVATPIPDVNTAYATIRPDTVTPVPGQKERYDKATELVETLRSKRERERRDMSQTEDKIKEKEYALTDKNDKKMKKEREINQKEMELEDYTLRTYLYKIVGASFITKYVSNGKKNPQFELLERKGYSESVKGSAEYQKNASQMIKDAPMFSQASCLQKKTEIQTMFDSILSRTKEKVANAIDSQIGGEPTTVGTMTDPDPDPDPGLFPELRKKYADLKTTYDKTKEQYKNYNVLADFVFHPDEPPNPAYFTPKDKCDIDIDCTATIRANESLEEKKKKEEEVKQKFERMTKISLGTYPPLLMPQGYYKMHQMVYYESSTVVDLDCKKPPPPFKKELTIANLDIVLNPSKIPMSFPALMSDDDNVKYNKSIKEKYLFRRAQID